ncbi:MAG: pirin family protein [Hyphomicrobiaceae bacterium]|nr:pirin family protein [Hyphomicrobiaceae bacterium]
MSFHPTDDPKPGDRAACALIEQVIVPRARDLGGFEVRRALPAVGKQMVGPFIFFDQMGPAEFLLGAGIDVRPHPHIGLSTVTYLFDGEIYHRDSLGTAIPIRPGALNLMTAGRGIVHSERTALDVRRAPHRLYGIQAWCALPSSHEEAAPSFVHHGADNLPMVAADGVTARVIIGHAFGLVSPAAFPHPALYVHADLEAGARLPLDADYDERAIYIVSGAIEIAGDVFEGGRLLVFKPGDRITVIARTAARLMIVGGEPMDGPRHIWWNFVSSRKDRIDAAKADWSAGRFDTVPGDASEFISLPG